MSPVFLFCSDALHARCGLQVQVSYGTCRAPFESHFPEISLFWGPIGCGTGFAEGVLQERRTLCQHTH